MTVELGTIVPEAVTPQEAIEFFRSKGLAPPGDRFDYRDWWGANHARGFVVAKAMKDDVLVTIREAVDRAIAEGKTLDEFRRDLTPELQKLGWWGRQDVEDPKTGRWENVQLGSERRLAVIFDTNVRTAHAAGRWARIQRTKDRFPYLVYRQIQRPTKRDAHVPFHDLVLPVDHPFWLTHFPPNGYFCGCIVRQLTERALRRQGLKVSRDPTGQTRKVQNRRTGEIEDVPLGISPGFDTNPGAAFLAARQGHDRVAGNMPAEARSAELGLIDEARARGIRTGAAHLGVLDLDTGRAVGWTEDGLDDAALAALDDPDRSLAAVVNQPSSTAPEAGDVLSLAARPGLKSLTAVGHDGSLYRLTDAGNEIDAAVAEAYRIAAELLGNVPAGDASRLQPHVALLALSRRGLVRYRTALAPAMRLTAQRVGDRALEDIVRRVVEALAKA